MCTLKIWESINERRLYRDEQYGFMPGRGTADAIFVVRQRMEKHRGKQDCMWYFIDLQKAIECLVKKS